MFEGGLRSRREARHNARSIGDNFQSRAWFLFNMTTLWAQQTPLQAVNQQEGWQSLKGIWLIFSGISHYLQSDGLQMRGGLLEGHNGHETNGKMWSVVTNSFKLILTDNPQQSKSASNQRQRDDSQVACLQISWFTWEQPVHFISHEIRQNNKTLFFFVSFLCSYIHFSYMTDNWRPTLSLYMTLELKAENLPLW